MVNKRLIINEKWCKGCGICVAFCPKQVLVLKKGKVTSANRGVPTTPFIWKKLRRVQTNG